ncbi:MAG: HNH endonuclease [Acidimicrobiales bacterium]
MKLVSIKRYLAPYRVYGRVSTTVTYGFAGAMAPRDVYDAERLAEAMRLLDQDPGGDLTCVYCEALATSWDHLFGLVFEKKPTGHGHVLGNLVPACGRCNTRKGNRNWREFVSTLPVDQQAVAEERIQRLVDRFFGPGGTPIDLAPFPTDQSDDLMSLLAEVHRLLAKADELVAAHRVPIAKRREAKQGPPGRARDLPGKRQAFYAHVFSILGDRVKAPEPTDRSWSQFRNGPFGSFWIWLTKHELRAVCYLDTPLTDVDKGGCPEFRGTSVAAR